MTGAGAGAVPERRPTAAWSRTTSGQVGRLGADRPALHQPGVLPGRAVRGRATATTRRPPAARTSGRPRRSCATASKADVARLRKENPDGAGPVPAELVTASASGLDPHCQPGGGALAGAARRPARGVSLERVRAARRGRQSRAAARLPRRAARQRAAPQPRARPPVRRARRGAPPPRPRRSRLARMPRLSVLVVDDEKNIRATLRVCLEAMDATVVEAASARAALEAIGRTAFDVVVPRPAPRRPRAAWMSCPSCSPRTPTSRSSSSPRTRPSRRRSRRSGAAPGTTCPSRSRPPRSATWSSKVERSGR